MEASTNCYTLFTIQVLFTYLCDSGLRGAVVPLIANAVENDRQRQCQFDEFFPRCEAFSQRTDVTVFCLVTAEFHHVYISQRAT